MTSFEFFAILTNNISLFIVSFLIVNLIGYFFLIRKVVKSFLDPLFFNLITFFIGLSVVPFLYFSGNISLEIFIYTLLSCLMFFFIFKIVYLSQMHFSGFSISIKMNDNLPFILFWLFFTIYVSFTLFSYKVFGIPLFNDGSRLSTFSGSGLGFIQRFNSFLIIYIYSYIFYVLGRNKISLYTCIYIFCLFTVLIFGVFSGSRSSFLVAIFSFWGVNFYIFKNNIRLSKYKRLIVYCFIFSILTFFLQTKGNILYSFILFVERFISCGDLYWQSLPNSIYEDISIQNPYLSILYGLLGPIRLIEGAQTTIPIGFQLNRLIYPSLGEVETGPVAAFPISGLVFFGYYGGLFFSVIQGFICGAFLKIFASRSTSFVFNIFKFYSYYSLMTLLTDISAATGVFFDIILNFCFLIVCVFLITIIINNYKSNIDNEELLHSC